MKKLCLVFVSIAVLGGLGWGGIKGYKAWRQDRLVQQAKRYLEKADVSNAALCLQQAVRSNPSDVEACRLFASLAEMAHSPNALFWRQRVASLEPKESANYFDWARTALALNDVTSANEALSTLPAAAKQSAEYHKLQATLAWALKQIPQAEEHYVESLRLEPDNLTSHFNLATIRLAASEESKQENGRSTLRWLSTNAVVRCAALRELVADAMRRGDWDHATTDVSALVADSHSVFEDRVFQLRVLVGAKDPSMEPRLHQLQTHASTNSAYASGVGSWMLEQGRTAEASKWLMSLPLTMRTNPPLALVMADVAQKLEEWPSLLSSLKTQNWGPMEYLRFAVSARANKGLGNTAAQTVDWRRALKACANRSELLADLGKRVGSWGWQTELDEALWALFASNPKDKTTFLLLYNRLFAAGNTRALQSLLTQSVESRPQDRDLMNNLAMVTLLNNPTDTRGHALARDLFGQHPKDPNVLSTYAFSLHLQRKSTEALRLFEGLSATQLEQPAVAVYYGVILAAAGNGEKAKAVLSKASVAQMLPEERVLLNRALSGS